MQRPRKRFTIGRLMALICLLALGLAVLRHAITYWGTAEIGEVALVVLIVSHIVALFQRGRRMVFWAMFGVCGWAYMLLCATTSAEYLPTSRLLDDLHGRIYPNIFTFTYYEDDYLGGGVSAGPDPGSFRAAGHWVFSLFFALVLASLTTILLPVRPIRGILAPPDGSPLEAWKAR